jgi:hypothetical protein
VNLLHFPHLDIGRPLSASDEKETSKRWSMPSMFFTKK